MLNIRYLTLFLFKVMLISYFISHGLNLSHTLDSSLTTLQHNLQSLIGATLGITAYGLQIYSHLEVVVGLCVALGWRICSFLGLIAYLINSYLLSIDDNHLLIGIFFQLRRHSNSFLRNFAWDITQLQKLILHGIKVE